LLLDHLVLEVLRRRDDDKLAAGIPTDVLTGRDEVPEGFAGAGAGLDGEDSGVVDGVDAKSRKGKLPLARLERRYVVAQLLEDKLDVFRGNVGRSGLLIRSVTPDFGSGNNPVPAGIGKPETSFSGFDQRRQALERPRNEVVRLEGADGVGIGRVETGGEEVVAPLDAARLGGREGDELKVDRRVSRPHRLLEQRVEIVVLLLWTDLVEDRGQDVPQHGAVTPDEVGEARLRSLPLARRHSPQDQLLRVVKRTLGQEKLGERVQVDADGWLVDARQDDLLEPCKLLLDVKDEQDVEVGKKRGDFRWPNGFPVGALRGRCSADAALVVQPFRDGLPGVYDPVPQSRCFGGRKPQAGDVEDPVASRAWTRRKQLPDAETQ